MSDLNRILAATDFSEEAERASYRAALLAAERHAQLDLLHVVSKPSLDALRDLFRASPDVPDQLLENVPHALQQQADVLARKAGIEVTARVAVGHVLDEILLASVETDMLVVGAHGLNWPREAILGTTAERLLGKCKRPMLVVKRQAETAYERVLVAVDFSDYSLNALLQATWIAPNADITAVHAYEVPFEGQLRRASVDKASITNYRNEARMKAVDSLRNIARDFGGDRYRVAQTVEHGNASRVILAKEQLLDAELIVIGKHGRSVGEEWLVGSVTRHILAGSKCDVLVVQEGIERRSTVNAQVRPQ
jgi:nucleotide-binding universal stress UspA family protein